MLLDASEPKQPQTALNPAEAIEALLERVELAARQQRVPAEFFQQLLHELVGALGAISGAVWSETEQGLACIGRIGEGARSTERLSDATEHRLAAAVLLEGEFRLIAPGGRIAGEVEVVNDSEGLQCFAPRGADGVPGLVLRIGLRAGASLGARETAGGLLSAVADIALTFQLQHRLRSLHARDVFWRELDAAVLSIGEATGLRECARTIAEQSRRLLKCDRVSVLVWRGRRCRLAAISSATGADRRARQVRLLERIATEAARTGNSFQVQVGDGSRSYRTSETVESYLDETQLRTIRCDVLQAGRDDESAPTGCLVLESYTGEATSQWAEHLETLVPHCARALKRAVREQSRGWRRILSPWRSLSKSALWFLAAAVACGAGVALTIVQTDFTVEAAGRLMPARRRSVFAPGDAIVSELLVGDGSSVVERQPLVRLVDPDLEQENSRLSGELQTAAAKLDAIQARRKLMRGNRDTDASLLSIEESELKATVSGLEQQLGVVGRQRDRLQVLSPFAGRVSRWDLDEVLPSLPVRHGQVMMDVYDPAGPWRLELEIPDAVAGYVRQVAANGEPRVEYVFQSDSSQVFEGLLDKLADATEINSNGELSVRGIVNLAANSSMQPQRGASVTAKVHCGKRSCGFVWFREVIEFVQRRILF